jgi:G8 domain
MNAPRAVLGCALVACAATSAAAQARHDHTPALTGVPRGLPYFCASATVTSVTSGAWSNPATWSTRTVPGTHDKVKIGSGHHIMYDVVSDVSLDCVELDGWLSFRTDANTRMKVGDLTVMEEGVLDVGTPAQPVSADAIAELVIADHTIDSALDPEQIGTGVEALGTIRMHGAVRAPTFVRLAGEALHGTATLTVSELLNGWRAGDRIVIPDTRQLRESERRDGYLAQDEQRQIASIEGNEITLTAPLTYDHLGARSATGRLEFLPHIGNLSRNVIVRSEHAEGTRGHMIFMARADIDLRYVEVREMGRTRMGVLDNTVFGESGDVVRLGANQIGRYPIHFHHAFGPVRAPANGYQFTLIGNSVDGAPKWGITVHDSHYGLIQDNVVYGAHGAGIVTEDGTETANVFEHNFSMRAAGSGEFAPRSGYGGAAPDPGGEGAGFWFRGPNNYIRNNVAANADAFGFGLAPGSLGTVRVPAFKGADTGQENETVTLDTTDAPVLEFANNEAYGAMQAGAAWGWNGTVTNFRAWHFSRHGLIATPTDSLVVDGMTVRGMPSLLASDLENPAGIWLSNYAAKSVVVRNVDVQGMRMGVASPFYPTHQATEPGRGDGSVIVENGFFQDYVGVVIATAYSVGPEAGNPVKRAVVRDSMFAPLDVPARAMNPPAAISMNFRMAPNDPEPRDPIQVFGFNKKPEDNFRVYYSLQAPQEVAPCHAVRPEIGGWVCR